MSNLLLLKAFRECHPKICHFGTLVISLKALEKQQVEEGPLTLLFLPRNRRYNPHVQDALLDWEVKRHFFFFFFNNNTYNLFFFLIYFYIYFWLCWIFVSVRGLSPVAASGGHFSSQCAGLSLSRPLLLQSTGSRRAASVVVAHGPSCSAACGILPDQGSNPCPLHWQADSQPLSHQGNLVKRHSYL